MTTDPLRVGFVSHVALGRDGLPVYNPTSHVDSVPGPYVSVAPAVLRSRFGMGSVWLPDGLKAWANVYRARDPAAAGLDGLVR